MNLFLIGNVVEYDGKKWEIIDFGISPEGYTTFLLKRGPFKKMVLETEIERIEE